MTADRLARLLRQASPPVMVRVESERVVLDLRSVPPRHDIRLVEAIEAVSPRPAEEAEEKAEED